MCMIGIAVAHVLITGLKSSQPPNTAEAFLTKYHLAVVLEYADGGDMYDYVVSRKRLSENKVPL